MRILIGIFFFVLCFGSNSCQKGFTVDGLDSTIITPPQPVTGSFTAKINGINFIADKSSGATRALGEIAITGLNSNGEKIVLVVADSGVHVYTLDINSPSNAGAYNKDTAYSYATNQGNSDAESGGTLSITSIDLVNKTMSGTFSIKVYRAFDLTQKNITEGVFNNIPFETTAIPPSNSTDTFRVKVNGVDFPAFSVSGISAFGMVNFSASNQQVSKTVGISLPADITPGTYTFTLFGPSYIGQYNSDSAYMAADTGTITILEHNTISKKIRGTFDFHAAELPGTQEAQLTEGYFSITYQ